MNTMSYYDRDDKKRKRREQGAQTAQERHKTHTGLAPEKCRRWSCLTHDPAHKETAPKDCTKTACRVHPQVHEWDEAHKAHVQDYTRLLRIKHNRKRTQKGGSRKRRRRRRPKDFKRPDMRNGTPEAFRRRTG